jgi:hypothetical protein
MNPHSNFSEILPDVRAERAEVRSLNQHGHSVQMGAARWADRLNRKIAEEGAPEGEDRRARAVVRTQKMVRWKGFEPSRYCYRQPLKLVRLPVPPPPQKALQLHFTAAVLLPI